MSTTQTAPSIEEELLLKARAYGLCAQLLSEATRGSGAGPAEEELRQVLDRLVATDIVRHIDAFEAPGVRSGFPTSEDLKPLLRGDLSPYETSYEPRPGMSGGKPFQLADIAGFYRAFGFEVSGERPDHIVPELEFVALLCAKEAYARVCGEEEGAEVCRRGREAFLLEHLTAWLPQLSQRISEQAPRPALSALVEVIMALAAAEPKTSA
jgi:hypothetical protein